MGKVFHGAFQKRIMPTASTTPGMAMGRVAKRSTKAAILPPRRTILAANSAATIPSTATKAASSRLVRNAEKALDWCEST